MIWESWGTSHSFEKSEHYFYFNIFILEIQCSQCKAAGTGRLGICYDLSQFYLHGGRLATRSQQKLSWVLLSRWVDLSPAGPASALKQKKQQPWSKFEICSKKNQNECQVSWRQNSYLLVTDSNPFEETLISAEIQFGRNMYTCAKISSNCHVRRWMNLKCYNEKTWQVFHWKHWREWTKSKRMLKYQYPVSPTSNLDWKAKLEFVNQPGLNEHWLMQKYVHLCKNFAKLSDVDEWI